VIGMPSATPAGSGAGLPVAAAAAVPAAGLAAADQAFDDVFRQLTGGLLTTSAQAGEALAEAEFDAIVDGEGDGVDPASDGLPFGVVPVPVMFTLPAVTTPAPAVTDGEGGDIPADAAAGIATAVASTAPAAAGARGAQAGATITSAGAPGAAPFEIDTAPADGAANTPAAEDAEVLAAMTPPANAAGTATPATEVEAHVRGLDRRRGMRETPARARTFDTAAAGTAAETPAAPALPATGSTTPGTAEAPAPAAAAEHAGAAPREMPATAERAFALQRALARQSDNTHRDGAAPGLAAQVAQAGATASGGGGTGADDTPHGQKHGRAWTNPMVPGATLPTTAAPAAQSAAAAGLAPVAAPSEAAVPGQAASGAWRAAFAASALTETTGAAADAARTPGAPGLVTGLPAAVELAAIRDRGPAVVDTPLAMPDLDAATGEAVHTQIVKSIRMQWTGGLGEARVTLKPEYLGEVTASIKVEQGVVTATLQADTPEVRRWMESHTATLRDALVEHGLKLDRLTVGEPERQAAQGDRQPKPRQQPQEQAPRQRARREASETDTPFEVTTD
jgi:flagellar hook-length control protein FliK